MPENKPQKEPSGEIEFHATASPVVEPDEDTTEGDLDRKIRQIVREEFATVGLSDKAGAPGLPGESIKGEPGADGENGKDGTDANIYAGGGLAKSGNVLVVDLTANKGLELSTGGMSGTLQAKVNTAAGLKLTADGIEINVGDGLEVVGDALKVKLGDGLEIVEGALRVKLDIC